MFHKLIGKSFMTCVWFKIQSLESMWQPQSISGDFDISTPWPLPMGSVCMPYMVIIYHTYGSVMGYTIPHWEFRSTSKQGNSNRPLRIVKKSNHQSIVQKKPPGDDELLSSTTSWKRLQVVNRYTAVYLILGYLSLGIKWRHQAPSFNQGTCYWASKGFEVLQIEPYLFHLPTEQHFRMPRQVKGQTSSLFKYITWLISELSLEKTW